MRITERLKSASNPLENLSKSAQAIRIATRRPERFPHASMGLIIWLTVAWVMLWGNLTPGNFLAGFALALLVTTVAPFPATPFDGRFRPWAVVRLVVIFIRDLFVASFQQARFILSGKKPTGAIIRIHLRSHSDTYLAMISGMTALVPGSVVMEAHRVTGTLYIHVFDTGLSGGVDGTHRTVLGLEERVLRAFGSHDELVDAGYVPGSSPKAGRLPTPYAPATGESVEIISDLLSEHVMPVTVNESPGAARTQRIAGNSLQRDLDTERVRAQEQMPPREQLPPQAQPSPQAQLPPQAQPSPRAHSQEAGR